MSDLITLIRQSYDIGIIGKKGSFKTFILSLLGYIQYYRGYTIFSNYHLNYPHIRIYSLADFNKIFEMDPLINKIFLGDDFERWFDNISRKSNIELNQILLDFGKVNCSLYYTCKRSMSINIGLRDGTSEFWFPAPYLAYTSGNSVVDKKMSNYLNFLKVVITRYDEDLEELDPIEVNKLQDICMLYSTIEQVKPLMVINNDK